MLYKIPDDCDDKSSIWSMIYEQGAKPFCTKSGKPLNVIVFLWVCYRSCLTLYRCTWLCNLFAIRSYIYICINIHIIYICVYACNWQLCFHMMSQNSSVDPTIPTSITICISSNKAFRQILWQHRSGLEHRRGGWFLVPLPSSKDIQSKNVIKKKVQEKIDVLQKIGTVPRFLFLRLFLQQKITPP